MRRHQSEEPPTAIEDNSHDGQQVDGEGVWTPDIEQCFREALLLFPPCGRRKHVLQDESGGGGKMYGRNELIARHIMMRTGKSRSRKQVYSHIQVLARRKAKADAANLVANNNALVSDTTTTTNSIATIRSSNTASTLFDSTNSTCDQSDPMSPSPASNETTLLADVWFDRDIVAAKVRLVEFCAFIEQRICADQFHQINLCATNNAPFGEHVSQINTLHLPLATSFQINTSQIDHSSLNFRTSNLHQPVQIINGIELDLVQSNQPLPDEPYSHSSIQSINTNNNQVDSRQAQVISHNLVQIDYKTRESRDVRKLEQININILQNKFPDLCGNEGLYARASSNSSFFLVKFWANLSSNNFNYNKFSQIEDQNSFFGFSSRFEAFDSTSFTNIVCSTKVFSYGLQVVERVEKLVGSYNQTNGRLVFESLRSPMCEFVVHFIRRLRGLSRRSHINNVLENFNLLQVITSEQTSEILLCLAYVFEASADENHQLKHCVYKLTKD